MRIGRRRTVGGQHLGCDDSTCDASLSGKVYIHIPSGVPPGLYTVKGRVGIMHQENGDGEVFTSEIVEGEYKLSGRTVDDR